MFRGRSYGRGRGRGAFSGHRFGTGCQDTALPAPSVSQRKIKDISMQEIQAPEEIEVSPKIRNVKLVASFNWKEALDDATILVPGCPPKWQPPALPQSLREDSGVYYRDPNSARYHTFPIEPAVRVVLNESTVSGVSDTDIFGCGNTLGCLLSAVRHEERTFRFGVERVGQTIFLVRKPNTPREIIEDVRGYGHAFPDAYTAWDPAVRGSASHQRIISYNFMGFGLMIRSECDGYLPDSLSASELCSQTVDMVPSTKSLDLDSTFPILGLGASTRTPRSPSVLTIAQAGQRIPQHAIFDLKTRSIKAKDRIENSMDEFYPRLWVNQTPNFILAFHERGRFEQANINIKPIANDIQGWEEQNSSLLCRLAGLLRMLVDLSKNERTAKFEVRRTGSGPVQIWSENPGWSALPDNIKAQWRAAEKSQERGEEPNAISKAGAADEKWESSSDEDEGVGAVDEEWESSSDEDEGDFADYLKF